MTRRQEREEYRAGGNGYYHFCTDGLSGGLIFNNVAQFAFGMILMGLVCLKIPITIYAFVLMPNHVHIVFKGTGAQGLAVFDYLKRKLSVMLQREGFTTLPEDYWFKLVKLDDEEQLRREILYVLRNPLEKELGTVGGYLWGSGWIYYSDFAQALGGTEAKLMSKRKKIKYFTSEESIPDHWKTHPYLGLLPDSFVDIAKVKELFPSPKDLQTSLVKDYEIFFQIANRLGELCEFSKAEISGIVNQVLHTRFEGKSLNMLRESEKGKLAIILNREYGLNSYQISTSIFIKEKVVRQLLNSKELR